MPPDQDIQHHYATLKARVAALERELKSLAALVDHRYMYHEGRFDGAHSRVDQAVIRIGRLELAADIK